MFLLIAAGVGVNPAAAAPPAESRLFELREYQAAPGKLAALHDRFRDHTLALHEKHGITNVACFTVAEPGDERVYVLIAYPDAEARRRAWEGVVTDPEWHRVRRTTEAEGRLVERIREYPLVPAADCKAGLCKITAGTKVFEFRTKPTAAGDEVVGSWTTPDGNATVRLVARESQPNPTTRVAAYRPEPLGIPSSALVPTSYSPLR